MLYWIHNRAPYDMTNQSDTPDNYINFMKIYPEVLGGLQVHYPRISLSCHCTDINQLCVRMLKFQLFSLSSVIKHCSSSYSDRYLFYSLVFFYNRSFHYVTDWFLKIWWRWTKVALLFRDFPISTQVMMWLVLWW